MTNIPKSFFEKIEKPLDKPALDVLYYRRRQGKRPGGQKKTIAPGDTPGQLSPDAMADHIHRGGRGIYMIP